MSPKKAGRTKEGGVRRKAKAGKRTPARKPAAKSDNVGAALKTLFIELVDGPPGRACFVLNPGDIGLLRSLDKLSSSAASRLTATGSSIAAHVDHLRYGFGLMNRWAAGDPNPWAAADWSESWKKTRVTDAEWAALRKQVAEDAHAWRGALSRANGSLSELELNGFISSVIHLGYHFGAIRQIDPSAKGPSATDAA
jgi:hypothetical protein